MTNLIKMTIFLITQFTSAIISLHQIVGTVSEKLNSLEKHLRHSYAYLKEANSNSISHIHIMLPNEVGDGESGLEFDLSIS